MILVSACLLGCKTKYNGGSNDNEILMKFNLQREFLPVCPECLGGLPVPHPPAEIFGGSGEDVLRGQARVMNKNGEDVTQAFLRGAERVLELIQKHRVCAAVLKERSPSCGVRQIYDGTFSRRKKCGMGVAAALLKEHKIQLYSEEEVNETLLLQLLEQSRTWKA